MTAQQFYDEKAEEVRVALSEIRILLRRHAKEQKAEPDRYDFGGDLAHVAESLRDVAGFLAGGKA